MKILLIGEYSRLHNSLKEGLQKLGHEVVLVGKGDGFKKFPVDHNFEARLFATRRMKQIASLLNSITGINLVMIERAYRFNKIIKSLQGYQVVQLINENSVGTYNYLEKGFVKRLKKSSSKIFLLACGIDYVSLKYANEDKLKYSILTPLKEDSSLAGQYKFILKKLSKKSKDFYDFISDTIDGIISSDLDYHIPYKEKKNYLGMIPNPVNVDTISFIEPQIDGVIKIFHGINSASYTRKGNKYFIDALEELEKKHPKKVKITSSEDLPYSVYNEAYKQCHIFLDQVYAYDQGYNALEAMSMGKVVFTGAEQEWLDYYDLKEDEVAINALPDKTYLYNKLERLILNPEEIKTISRNARSFIEREHHYIKIAETYIKTWGSDID